MPRKGKRERKSLKGRAKSARPSLARGVRETERAIGKVGEQAFKTGRIKIGETDRLTPTRAGFRALDSALREIERAGRKHRGAAWVLDLEVRFRGPNGQWAEPKKFPGAGLPRLQDVARFRRESNARFKKTKGKQGGIIVAGKRRAFKTDAETFRYLVERTIQGATFRTIDREKTVQGDTDQLLAELEGKEPEQVAKAFREFKSRRSLTFRAKLYRVVAGGASGGTKKGRAARRRTR